ncbi:MAG: hypothetical protein K8S27_15540 [Candidatus Omnitrophica bacterium]|nr:hypothetical protein [Candidatus Omnitrophota bacterium]
MDQEYPEYTPVVHLHEGYRAWVYDTTTSKDYFTGNTEVNWQYRLWVGDGKIKIAPQEDLKIDMDSPAMPECIEQQCQSESRYRKQTYLNAFGYKLTDTPRGTRWDILLKVAVPYLGARKVIKTVVDLIYGRSRSIEKNLNAIFEWSHDLDKLIRYYGFNPDIIDQYLLQYILNTKQKLKKHDIEMDVSVADVQDVYRVREEEKRRKEQEK